MIAYSYSYSTTYSCCLLLFYDDYDLLLSATILYDSTMADSTMIVARQYGSTTTTYYSISISISSISSISISIGVILSY